MDDREVAIAAAAMVTAVMATGPGAEDEAGEEDHRDDEDHAGDDAHPRRYCGDPRSAGRFIVHVWRGRRRGDGAGHGF
jgi:hypothetical protein